MIPQIFLPSTLLCGSDRLGAAGERARAEGSSAFAPGLARISGQVIPHCLPRTPRLALAKAGSVLLAGTGDFRREKEVSLKGLSLEG